MKIHKFITTTIIVGSFISVGFTFQAFGAVIGSIKEDGVNVRAGAASSSEKIETVNAGMEIEIIAEDGEWYKVNYANADGAYIYADYVDIIQATGGISGASINVRNAASTSADIVAKVNSGDVVTVTGQNGDWYRIRRSNGDTAYINKSFVSGELTDNVPSFDAAAAGMVNTYAIVTASSGLNLRSAASTSADLIEVISNDEVVDVMEVNAEWIKVKTSSGAVGFVSSDFVSVRTGEKPSRSVSSKGDQVVAYGKQFLGTPYSWGGTNLSKGVDCSGFVYSVMKNFGVTLNRSSASMASNGVYVDRSALRAGDLVFFDTTNSSNQGYISHVGIYMGDGNIIHSSSGKQWGVTINSLSEPYYNTKYVTARRVLR